MNSKKQYLIIDSNNLAMRVSFVNSELKNQDNVPTGLHYGYFQSLINLKQKFKGYQFLIVWDGKSLRRKNESEEAVKLGIIPEAYKANRKKEVMPQPILDFYAQAPYLKRALEYTGIPQIMFSDYEADDVVGAYCKLLGNDNEVICVTSDGDYAQLLNKNVSIFDGMKNRHITAMSFKEEYGITPLQYLDSSCLMGDDGDNIYGVSGWGEKTSIKEIKIYGSWQNLINAYKEKHKELLVKYPNYGWVVSAEEQREFLEKVVEAKSKKGKIIFPEVKMNMPYARVLLAFAKEEIKIPKTEIMALLFEERIRLAYSLKKMDTDIPDLPEITQGELNKDRLIEYFDYYDIETLKDAVDLFE
jgi:5'-3' exonuclease